MLPLVGTAAFRYSPCCMVTGWSSQFLLVYHPPSSLSGCDLVFPSAILCGWSGQAGWQEWSAADHNVVMEEPNAVHPGCDEDYWQMLWFCGGCERRECGPHTVASQRVAGPLCQAVAGVPAALHAGIQLGSVQRPLESLHRTTSVTPGCLG